MGTVRANKNFNKNQILNVVLQKLSGDHASPVEGLLWYDQTAKGVKFYDGTNIRLVPIADGNASTLNNQNAAFYLARANHTGTQTVSTISNFEAAVLAYRLDQFASPTAAVNFNSQKGTNVANGTANGDLVNYGQLTGALSDKASTTYVDNKIAALTTGAPALLDTLDELAAAIGDDANFATTIQNQISQRAKTYSETIGNGSATSGVITHNMNTRKLVGSAASVASPYDVQEVRLEWTTVNTATWYASPAPTTGELEITLIGR